MLTALKVWTGQVHPTRWDSYVVDGRDVPSGSARTPAVLITCDSVDERNGLLALLADAEAWEKHGQQIRPTTKEPTRGPAKFLIQRWPRYWTGNDKMPWSYAPALAMTFNTKDEAVAYMVEHIGLEGNVVPDPTGGKW